MSLIALYTPKLGLQRLRECNGSHLWRIVIRIEREGREDEHVISPAERLTLTDLYPVAAASIAELLPPGVIADARMEIHAR